MPELPHRRDLPQDRDVLAKAISDWLSGDAGLTRLPRDVQEYLDEFCFLYHDDDDDDGDDASAGGDRVQDLFKPLLTTACLWQPADRQRRNAVPRPS
jgi:hypothetical protein